MAWLQQRLREKPWSLCRAKESHCAKETAHTLGWRDLGKHLGDSAVEGKLRGSTRKNVIFSNSLWTNSEYPISLKNMSI